MNNKKLKNDLPCNQCLILNSKIKEFNHSLRSPLSVLCINFEDLKEKGLLGPEALEDTSQSLNELVRLVEGLE